MTLDLPPSGGRGSTRLDSFNVTIRDLDADVSLSISFGCRYFWFNLLIASSTEPVVKCPYCSSAFNVLLVNAMGHDELPGKLK